jgi:hypothetical protein
MAATAAPGRPTARQLSFEATKETAVVGQTGGPHAWGHIIKSFALPLFDPGQNFFQFGIRIFIVVSSQQTRILTVHTVKSTCDGRDDLCPCHRDPLDNVQLV